LKKCHSRRAAAVSLLLLCLKAFRNFGNTGDLMKNFSMKKLVCGLMLALLTNFSAVVAQAQTDIGDRVFGKINFLSQNGDEIKETQVRVRFGADTLEITKAKDGTVLKTFKYEEIKNAEYSYTKHPRWKSGLGLSATSIIFPPILLISIPLGFTKHRRHWLTIKTEKDYAVLQLSKGTRKIFIPAFESHSAVKIDALGESK